MPRIYNPPKCGYSFEGNHIVADGTVRPGRISGTMMAGVLGRSPWSTPFQVACNLLGLCSENIGNKPAVKMGQALEGRIIDYLNDVYRDEGVFVPAEQVYEKREGDHDSWVSDFEDDVFAGHVDGIVVSPDGENYILEIKTSANLDAWENGVPDYYYWQVALYNEFITKQDSAYVGLGMVSQDDYGHSEDWVANELSTVMFRMPIDREDVKAKIEEIREWYKEYVLNGRTPDYDPSNPGDVEMYAHLVNLSAPASDIAQLVDKYFELDNQVKEAEKAVKDKAQLRDDIKSKIKTYMEAHDMKELSSSTGMCKAGLSETVSFGLDKDQMVKDGIDLAPYTTKVVTKRFTVKKCKTE